jgi:hypothetical protein
VTDILRTARGVFALLSPLTGTQSTGTITARAIDADVHVPAGSYIVPTDGALATRVLVKTTAAATVTAAGTTIAVKSAFGGGAVNLNEGTVLRWHPKIDGLQETCTVTTALTNGAPGAVKSLRLYEQIRTSSPEEDVRKASIDAFPALALYWDGSEAPAPRTWRTEENWVLGVFTSRLDNDDLRRAEGLHLMQEARELLLDKHAVDGEVISTPSGIQIGRCRRLVTNKNLYIYTIAFRTGGVLEKRDSRVFNPWLVTRYDLDTGADPAVEVVNDARYSME